MEGDTDGNRAAGKRRREWSGRRAPTGMKQHESADGNETAGTEESVNGKLTVGRERKASMGSKRQTEREAPARMKRQVGREHRREWRERESTDGNETTGEHRQEWNDRKRAPTGMERQESTDGNGAA